MPNVASGSTCLTALHLDPGEGQVAEATAVRLAVPCWPILDAEMRLLRRLALRVGRELARNPDARAKAAQALAKAQRVLKDDIKPRAQQAWRDGQPEIQRAKHRLQQVAQELREEYRKGRNGE